MLELKAGDRVKAKLNCGEGSVFVYGIKAGQAGTVIGEDEGGYGDGDHIIQFDNVGYTQNCPPDLVDEQLGLIEHPKAGQA